jgi:hypothetical protein
MIVSRHMPQRLLFCAYPVGYGPAAKALVLAAQCRSIGLETIFAGQGVSYELVSRSSEVFEEVVHAGATEDRARLLVRDSAAVVSIMDRDFASLAAELSRPLHVVDSLLWMRDHVPEAFRPARRYWAQDFIGVGERIHGLVPRGTVVGPILNVRQSGSRAVSRRLVVNLGGLATADDTDRAYGELVLRAIGRSRLTNAFEQITILASASTIEKLEPCASECDVELASLAHDAAVEEMATAALVLTAPGLTTALECFRIGRPTLFLPPQNYSQWTILKALRGHGLAPHALHWEDLSERHALPERIGEPERTARVRAAIGELAATPLAHEALSSGLSACLDNDLTVLANHQQSFFRSLGPNGAPVIAAELAGEVRG